MLRRAAIALSTCLLVVAVLSTDVRRAQSSQPAPPQNASAVSPSVPGSPSGQVAAQITDTEERLIRAEERIAALSDSLSFLMNMLEGVGAFVGFFLVAITLGSAWGFLRSEQRAAEAHSLSLKLAGDAEQRAIIGFQLGVKGEQAAQNRAEEVHDTFLGGSRNTLELVNNTLTLAKEASERAAKSVEVRAKAILHEYDLAAKDLLASVPEQDDRALVSDPEKAALLRSLASRIEGFQYQSLMLPDEIPLTPECMFVRGMECHLKQQFADAFAAWKEVTHRNDSAPKLKSKAWYWIGYEHNNLGDFQNAVLSFERSLDHTDGARRFELQRLLIESRFFNKHPESGLLQSLEALLRSCEASTEDGMDAVTRRILCTLGNIHISLGNRARAANAPEASKHYSNAAAVFGRASDDKWALFGLAEAKYWLGDPEAISIFEHKVRPAAIEEEIRRIEPRTKVLARTTELICCIRVSTLRSQVHTIHSQLTEALGRVEGRLTVYSQVQRRNVVKEEFRKDLAVLMSEYEQSQQTAARDNTSPS